MYIVPVQKNNYHQNLNKRCQTTFQGRIGDEFVAKLAKGADINTAGVMKELKGTFGLKSSNVEDALESLIGKVKELFNENKNITNRLNEAQDNIANFPKEKQKAVFEAENSLRNSFNLKINKKNQEIEQLKNEAEQAKILAAKYEPMVRVKSVEEIDTVLPKQAIQTIDEMIANKIPARKSMFEYLMTGKGQEKALEQIERNNVMLKAFRDDVTKIPSVAQKAEEMAENKMVYALNPAIYTLRLAEKSLKGAPDGANILSKSIKEQVKQNILGLLRSIEDGHINAEYLDRELNDVLKSSVEFHQNLQKGIDIAKKHNNDITNQFVEHKLNYDPDAACLTLKTKDGKVFDFSFQDLANTGLYS